MSAAAKFPWSGGASGESPRTDLRLQQAAKLEAVGRLAGGVAHDFNNLLTGVLLYCDLLIANLDTEHRGRKYAEEIRNAALQATGLVKQLLAVARPANSEARPLSLNEIADGMRSLLGRLIGENIELSFHLDPNLGLVRMDPTQAQQILLNLALNARDAMPGGGEITIETRQSRVQVVQECGHAGERAIPCALLAVADNGKGMDNSTRERLFEPFFTTKAESGTGLGLATVHEIVTTNGGLIHVESALGCGTRITMLLPLALPIAVPQITVPHVTAPQSTVPHITVPQSAAKQSSAIAICPEKHEGGFPGREGIKNEKE